jgi:hypothetical protein
VRREIGRVDLRVPTGELVDAECELDVEGAAAAEVEAHTPDAGGVERADLLVGDGRRQLGDAHERRPEPFEGIEQVRLVEPLEGATHHGATGDAQAGGARSVVVDGEGSRSIAADQREPRVDDVQVAVEDQRVS